jgi:hypothetical protein
MDDTSTMTSTTTSTTTSTEPALVELPARDELVVDGRGDPDDAPFRDAVRDLYTARAALGDPRDVPLEGSYWQAGRREDFDLEDRTGWEWQLVVPAPAGAAAPAAGRVWLRRTPAHRVVQLLHRGAFADEGPSLARLHAYAAEHGLAAVGPHVEVYLTDPRTTPDPDLRTVLRIPVGPAAAG